MRGSRGFRRRRSTSSSGSALRARRRPRSSRFPPTGNASTARSDRGRPGTRSSPSSGSCGRTAGAWERADAAGELGRDAGLRWRRTARAARSRAELVDVGAGTQRDATTPARTCGASSCSPRRSPRRCVTLAVERFGAAGIVSYAQNQRTAWWGEDENLVRWGHLEHLLAASRPSPSWSRSSRRAPSGSGSLAGETVRLQAAVRAGKHAGAYEVVTATIPGADPALRAEEIVFSCHLDHPRPGANDNASGCATILEVGAHARQADRRGHACARPARTIRFVWPPEIEGTLALLNARPGARGRGSRPRSTSTWSAAARRPRRSSTSPAARRACRRSSTTWPRRSARS